MNSVFLEVGGEALCSGPIDLFAEGMDGGTETAILGAVIQQCQPRLYMSENTLQAKASQSKSILIRNGPSDLFACPSQGFSLYQQPLIEFPGLLYLAV